MNTFQREPDYGRREALLEFISSPEFTLSMKTRLLNLLNLHEKTDSRVDVSRQLSGSQNQSWEQGLSDLGSASECRNAVIRWPRITIFFLFGQFPRMIKGEITKFSFSLG